MTDSQMFGLDGCNLFYTSAINDTNIRQLREYIQHHFLGAPFSYKMDTKRHESIIVPIGQDSEQLLGREFLRFSELVANDEDRDSESFMQVMKRIGASPMRSRYDDYREADEVIEVEDPQRFLRKMHNFSMAFPGASIESLTPSKVTPSRYLMTGDLTSSLQEEEFASDLNARKVSHPDLSALTKAHSTKSSRTRSSLTAGAGVVKPQTDVTSAGRFFKDMMRRMNSSSNLNRTGTSKTEMML